MPSLVELVLHPGRARTAPEPVPVRMRPVLLTGIAAWTLALVVTAVGWAVGAWPVAYAATCAAGIVLGGLMLLWDARRERRAAAPTPAA